jgi:diketogulonate reductase-like aldo/keto reductase
MKPYSMRGYGVALLAIVVLLALDLCECVIPSFKNTARKGQQEKREGKQEKIQCSTFDLSNIQEFVILVSKPVSEDCRLHLQVQSREALQLHAQQPIP